MPIELSPAMLTIKVKRLHPQAKLPTKAHATDAGWDLYAVEGHDFARKSVAAIPTGIALEIPPGWYCQIQGRSGLAAVGIYVTGGVIDSSYRGEIKVILNCGHELGFIEPGDKIAQLVLFQVPEAEMVEVAELGESDRGTNGFGSSGR